MVPWVDRPALKYTPSPRPTPTAQFRDCTAADLAAKFGSGGAAAGTFYQRIALTDRSAEPCSLDGAPARVDGIRADGSQRTLASASGSMGTAPGLGPGAANLSPGDQAFVTVATSDACSAGQAGQTDRYASLVLVLDDRSEIDARPPSPINAVCGLDYFDFGIEQPAEPDQTSPLDALQASTDLPSELPAGKTVAYTVTLTNTSDRLVSLDPCPSYQQFIGLAPSVLEFSYDYLNCDTVQHIKPGQSVRYEMRLDVPEKPQRAKFSWTLQATQVGVGGTPIITSG